MTRLSDGKLFVFDDTFPQPSGTDTLGNIMRGEGLALTDGAAPPAVPGTFAGAANKDQFLLSPMQGVAGQMQAQQYSPRELAAANPINGARPMPARCNWVACVLQVSLPD